MLSAKNDFALQLLFFGNFVNEADRGPIEIQFTANFLQIPEKFRSTSTKATKTACWKVLDRPPRTG
jgi:hypothetical protein